MTLPVFGRLPLSAALGLLIVAATVVLFVFGPMLAPFGQEEVLGTPFADPSAAHLLGLDQNGRDMLSRLLYGAQMSVGVSLAAVLISFCIGIPLGFLAALTGGWPDLIGARFVDVIMSIPVLISALVVLQALGSSLPVLIGTIALLDSTRVFRLSRVVAQGIVVMEYAEVARLRGEGLWWMLRREILPNALPPVLALAAVIVAAAVLTEAALSFLGLGDPNVVTWGGMIAEGRTSVHQAWWVLVFPLITLFLTVLSFSQLGEGLKDRFDPVLR